MSASLSFHHRRTPRIAAAGLALLLTATAASAMAETTQPEDGESSEVESTEPAETEPAATEPAKTESPEAATSDASADATTQPPAAREDPGAQLNVTVKTNGVEYLAAPGAQVAVGTEVEWTYEVSNVGEGDALLLAFTDTWTAGDGSTGSSGGDLAAEPGSEEPGATVPEDPRGLVLEPGDTWISTAYGTAIAGQFTNTVTIDAISVDDAGNDLGEIGDAEGTSWYFGGQAGVSLVKKLNGQAISAPPGLGLAPGDALNWTYEITNTGNVALENVAMVDRGGIDGAKADVASSGGARLAPGESTTVTSTGAAQVGQYANTATVTATGLDGVVVTAADDAWYVGGRAAFTAVAETNGVRSDQAPGVTVATGSAVVTTVEVTNTGDTYLDGFTVAGRSTSTDGAEFLLTATSSTSGPLAPGASRTFVAPVEAATGQFTTTMDVAAVAVNAHHERLPQQPAPASVSSWFLAGATGLTVTKQVNSDDASSAPGLAVTDGEEVTWTYTVTNTGTLALTDLVVVDADTSPSDATPDPIHSETIPTLAPGASLTLTATGSARAGQYRNTVTVTAADPERPGQSISAADDAYYYGGVGALEVTKQVREAADGEFVDLLETDQGAELEWQIVVTNSGSTVLSGVVANDGDIEATARNEDLEPGESATFVFTGVAQEDLVNTVTVEAADPHGTEVTASATAELIVAAAPQVEDDSLPEDSQGGSATGWIVGGIVVVLAGAGLTYYLVKRRSAQTEGAEDGDESVEG